MRRFNINVNGKAYDVAVEELAAGAAAPVVMAVPPVAAPVAAAPVAAAGAGVKVESPMPGTIIGLKVAVGDMVTEGQPIIILEAMKMENDIVAPKAGKISSILVKKGDNVNANDVLATVE